ncbi:DUF4283 domain-containing protein [Cephalotus follicularis]|uniref:DUF4283 domain-containing protein n=1 Tax=Cephalotus follicularis TaxID=3775 RepID=A0A1Q3BSH4_CEPFO|nr:DUF4283 domain-containing protein [Cephalotus follicularis]
MVANGVVDVRPPLKILDKGEQLWKGALVGHFVGKKMPFNTIKDKDSITKKWKAFGNYKIHTLANGIFLFKFENGESSERVLNEGPWDIWGVHIALRKWDKNVPLNKDYLDKVPLWVKLCNIPLAF